MKPSGPESAREKAMAEGRALRARVPRSSQAAWAIPAGRPDPVAVLVATSKNRLANLLPLRYGRMS